MTRYLVTSALPYINGVKHLGNMIGSMLPADIYARYLRGRGHEVLYICATDEHGTPAELAAAAAGLPVAEFCAEAHDLQKNIYAGFEMSFDYFGRSSSIQNAELTQHFARMLHQNGFIEERAIKQVYSPADGRFLPDRYVEGTCPKCGYDRARGDQCENCTSVLDPTDLVNPRSAISGSTDLEIRETKHLFLLQSKLQNEVAAWVDKHSADWPLLATSIARKWLTEGLHDRAITRDLEWGVPVPADTWPELAAENKVFYVWFDAPIEYIGATKEWHDAGALGCGSESAQGASSTDGLSSTDDPQSRHSAGLSEGQAASPRHSAGLSEGQLASPRHSAGLPEGQAAQNPGADGLDWESWWRLDKGADDVFYTQFMAKDNVPFHTVMFPATELGTKEPWKLVDYVKGFSWLTYYGGKFSTSLKRGIFTDDALALWPADYWRYFLVANAPESDDADFTWENFASTVNKDLADTLGNFVNRVLTFTAKKFGNEIPAGGTPGIAEQELIAEIENRVIELQSALRALEFRKAAQALRAIWAAGNGYLVVKEPWKEIKTDPEAAALSLRTAINLIYLYGILSEPFIPETAAKLRGVLGKENTSGWVTPMADAASPAPPVETPARLGTVAEILTANTAGQTFTVPPVLFTKITDDDVKAYRVRFGPDN